MSHTRIAVHSHWIPVAVPVGALIAAIAAYIVALEILATVS